MARRGVLSRALVTRRRLHYYQSRVGMKDYHAALSEKEKAELLEKQRAGGFQDGQKISDGASRRSGGIAVLWHLHAIDARRLHERRSWVVSFSILRPFGPTSSLLDLA